MVPLMRQTAVIGFDSLHDAFVGPAAVLKAHSSRELHGEDVTRQNHSAHWLPVLRSGDSWSQIARSRFRTSTPRAAAASVTSRVASTASTGLPVARARKRLTIVSGFVRLESPAFMRRYAQDCSPSPFTEHHARSASLSCATSRRFCVVVTPRSARADRAS